MNRFREEPDATLGQAIQNLNTVLTGQVQPIMDAAYANTKSLIALANSNVELKKSLNEDLKKICDQYESRVSEAKKKALEAMMSAVSLNAQAIASVIK